MREGIQVFQDLSITSKTLNDQDIRDRLITRQTNAWVHSPALEANLRGAVGDGESIIVFEYIGESLPKAELTLWKTNDSFDVTNIVPVEASQLKKAQYNALLQDFVSSVAVPASADNELVLEITDDVRAIESWISDEAARCLRRFSLGANKSTTNTHPSDSARWEAFVIEVHLGGRPLSTDVLIQWLIEFDGWDESAATKLAIDYENGLSLLGAYDAYPRGE